MGERGLCKDFQRNICFRGDRCKFEHPRAPGEDEDAPMKLTFCGQFQNGQCTFRNCHYIHADNKIEQEYRRSGTLPVEVARDVIDQYNLCIKYLKGECEATACKFKHTNISLDLTGLEDLPPKRSREPQSFDDVVKKFDLCKDFINDRCHRGDSCKFSHASPQDCGMNQSRWSHVERFGNSGPPDRKRRMMDDDMGPNMWMRGGDGMGMRGGIDMAPRGDMGMGQVPPLPSNDYMRLQRENEQLRMENSDLRREMDGLKATNKFLLEETANMRLAAKTGGAGMGGVDVGPGVRGGFNSMGGGVNMGAGGSGYGGSNRQQVNPEIGYGGSIGQQVNSENQYSQDRSSDGNQMYSGRRDEAGRW